MWSFIVCACLFTVVIFAFGDDLEVDIDTETQGTEIIRILEGGSFALDNNSEKLEKATEDTLRNLVFGPNELVSLAGTCFHYIGTNLDHDEFTVCPFRNVTFGTLRPARPRSTIHANSMDESLVGIYKGWSKAVEVMDVMEYVETVLETVETIVDTKNEDEHEVRMVQVFDNGHYCRMGEVYSAVLSFRCRTSLWDVQMQDQYQDVANVVSTDEEKKSEEEEAGISVEFAVVTDTTALPATSDIIFKEADFNIAAVERGSYMHHKSSGEGQGDSNMDHWTADASGCTYRIFLEVPVLCTDLPFLAISMASLRPLLDKNANTVDATDIEKTVNSVEETSLGTTEATDDVVKLEIEYLVEQWGEWGITVNDLGTSDPPLSEPTGSAESEAEAEAEADVATSDSEESTSVADMGCSCCAELVALKQSLKLLTAHAHSTTN